MKRRALVLVLAVGVLSACVSPMDIQSDAVPASTIEAQQISGSNGDVDFTLSDAVFEVERPTLVHLLLVAVYLPLIFM